LLLDAFGRVAESVSGVLDGAEDTVLQYRPDPGANTACWLVWHLTRIQDDHVSEVAGREQMWHSDGWEQRFGLPLDSSDTGYGHGSEQVAAVRASAELLRGYFDATYQATQAYLGSIRDTDLDQVVDERWDPPVTLAVRLVSVINDDMEHAGQAAYVRGLAERG
jgi:hypothetical protein